MDTHQLESYHKRFQYQAKLGVPNDDGGKNLMSQLVTAQRVMQDNGVDLELIESPEDKLRLTNNN